MQYNYSVVKELFWKEEYGMHKHYSEELIEDIRISNDILAVVGSMSGLKEKGKNYFGLCPFHNEKPLHSV